ncbi:hypothetical protein [Arabidopsis thaliana]|uniref:Uncharacterized protein F19C17.37 n=1 Tax=Arabidopsis thaliana TaxID=3702 RepID=Q9C759_ARATH|nr:hypothetical protein [Arabidopsis thaliana]
MSSLMMHCLIHVQELMNVKGIVVDELTGRSGPDHAKSLDPRTSLLRLITRPLGRVPPRESLDHFTRPPGRVSSPLPPSPSLDYILDVELQSLLHSALNQTLEHKEEKKTPAIHSTSHSTTLVEYSS